ncbi:hypothetical protein P1X14_08560 [Sphingomonas sp. AOB5]|uniref:hypothetical protein n=1 Tax=Sphingomonas sp. AOB5 TaxID=3034017 RepID=UPI0023F861CE|nr:hypothetical protein [Sphingomonas sp. AOB5]MDF7775296.1 hypothetical protein [Sphingomonas sp. AOB5]
MSKMIGLIAALALCACGDRASTNTMEPGQREIEPATLPFDNSTGFLDGFTLNVAHDGSLTWNSAPIEDATLEAYLSQWAARPRDAGSLFVAFEPGVPTARAEWVRRKVIDSGLCAQDRCREVGWDIKRPVVN